jgi:catechol 2,3-dioxygenase-like lactoylglutathione lyase family enzyme
VREQFCPHANLFCDREHLDRWHDEAGRPVGRVLTLAEAAQLGRQTWRRDGRRWSAGIDAVEAPQAAPSEGARAACSCCGEERDRLVPLLCHDDIKVCPVCIGWLRSRSGMLDVTPILPVLDMPISIRFYEAAGFTVREYEPGGGYAFVTHDDESVFDLAVSEDALDPATNRAGCYVIVPDVDAWHDRLDEARLPVTDPADQPHGMREFVLTDPNGNRLRIGHPCAE